MKQLILVLSIFLLFTNISKSQEKNPYWLIRASYGIEKHDKRLFNYSEKELLLRDQPEIWGTNHFILNFERIFFQMNRFSIFVGTGLNYEKATFIRPFDHFYFKKDSFYILLHLNRYEKFYVPFNISSSFDVHSGFSFYLEFTSAFLIYRKIDNTESNSPYFFPYSESLFEFNKLFGNLGINYTWKGIQVGVNFRIFNYQKIDKIIFNKIIKDPRSDQKWEWYNPGNFNFTIGYNW